MEVTVNPLRETTGNAKNDVEAVPPYKPSLCFDCIVPCCVYGSCLGGFVATLAIFVR
jgi:hypothetical protein